MELSGLKILDSLRAVLRYLMAGVVFMLASYVVNKCGLLQVIPNLLDNPWLFLVVSAVVGFFTYGIHVTVFDDLFFWISVKSLERFDSPSKISIKKIRDGINSDISAEANELEEESLQVQRGMLFDLMTCQLERSGTKVSRFLAINRKLTEAYNIMVFMYCCGYLLLFVFLFCSSQDNTNNDINPMVIFMLGIASFITGLVLDIKTTRRELWFISEIQLNKNNILYPPE